MTIDGREDLFHYTYLNAHGYLEKFREKLGMPNLTIPMLAAALKEYKNRTRLMGFITKNKQGKPCLYLKSVLNRILGITDDGHTITDPKANGELDYLRRIFDEWDMKSAEKQENSKKLEKEIPSYENDEEDMQKVSDKMIYNDNYGEISEAKKKTVKNDKGEVVPDKCDKCGGEVVVQIHGEPVYVCKKCGKYFGTMPFNMNEKKLKRKHPKKVYISESQLGIIKKAIMESYFVESEKVRIVKDFLDKNFVKGAIPAIGEDGYGKAIKIVGMKIPYSDTPKNMSASQLFYLLQDKFSKIYNDPKQRDNFLKKVMTDWYENRITKDGLLSRNNY